jgi:hypothetical protein
MALGLSPDFFHTFFRFDPPLVRQRHLATIASGPEKSA